MIKANSQFSKVNLMAALEFGNGDILVTDGLGEDYVNVMFTNHEPHPVGTEHEGTKGKTSDDIQPQVAMFFSNVGSIDVVIGKLMEARQNLIHLQSSQTKEDKQ